MSYFDAIKIADGLEEATVATVKGWFKTYLREFELQSGEAEDVYPLPRAYVTAERFDRENADQLPAIVVVSPGLSGSRPRQEGDGSFRVPFSIAVGIFVAGKDRHSTKRLVRVYTAIIRTIMLQKQSLGGFASGTTWLDESYDDNFQFTETQTVGAGQVVFEIWVDNVVNRYGGPAVYGGPPPDPDPDTQPGSDWGTADVVTATVGLKED